MGEIVTEHDRPKIVARQGMFSELRCALRLRKALWPANGGWNNHA